MSWKTKFRLFQIVTYGIWFVVVAIMAVITGKYIETVGLLASFVVLRNAFSKTWHSKSFWWCIFISCAIFAASIAFIPNKGVSIFACIIFDLGIDYLAYKYRDYDDLILQVSKPFNVDTCTQAELLTRCREIGLSEENTELAIEFFVVKTKQSEIADRLCINEKSVQIRKKRLRQKLNKN